MLRLNFPFFLFLLFSLLCFALSGQAAVHYVNNSGSPTCSDSGSGTLANPWCTISYGLSHINGGDTLYVRTGTYNGDYIMTGPSGTAGAHTVLAAYPGDTPVLSGSGYSSGRFKISHGCSYIDFIGFIITNLNQGLYLDDDAGTSTACTNVTVQNITIHDVGQEGLAVRAGTTGSAPRNFLIENSTIYNTGRLGQSSNGEGMYIGNSGGTDTTNGVTVIGNTIHDTQDECIELKGDSHDNIIDGNTLYNCISPGSSYSNGGGAIEIDEPRNGSTNPNQIVRNNVIHDIANNAGITKVGIRAGTGAAIYNNILYDIYSGYNCIQSNTANYPRLIYHNTVDCSSSKAIVDLGTSADIRNNIGPTGAYNLPTNNAYFVNEPKANYHLVAGSAPINAGADLTGIVPVDIEGTSRIVYAPPDLGAYEYHGGPAPPTNLKAIAQ